MTALFFLVILVLTLVMLYIKTEWFKFYFIYATNWTFILMTFGAILEAILVIVRYRGEKNISNWQFVGTISIWISSMTYAGEMLITFCYWTAIHDWTSTNTKYNDAAFYFNLTHHLAPVSKIYITQCGNFMIFLSLTFDAKSILGILEVQKLPF